MLKKKLSSIFNYKVVVILIGIIYITLTSLNLIWSFYTIQKNFSRFLLINIGFQCVLLLVSLFYIINIYYKIKELLIPFIIALVYAVVLLLVWIVIMFSIEILSYEYKIDIFNVDIQTKLRILPFLCFCIFTYSFSAYFLIKLYLNFDKVSILNKPKGKTIYAYRRYGKLKIT